LKSGSPVVTGVGSSAVREAIEKYQLVMSLYGHSHESGGEARIGKSLVINPASEYSDGVLRGASHCRPIGPRIAIGGCLFTHVMNQDGNDFPQPTKVNIGTIASLSAIGIKVREAIDIPLGVIVGHNDGPASVAISKAISADFIRVKVLVGAASGPNGWIEGCSVEVGLMKWLLNSNILLEEA
jgi:hypothetical protein